MGDVCPSQGFVKVSVNYLINLGVVELIFGNASCRPEVNLQGCIVGEEVVGYGYWARSGKIFKISPNGLLATGDTYLSPKNFF